MGLGVVPPQSTILIHTHARTQRHPQTHQSNHIHHTHIFLTHTRALPDVLKVLNSLLVGQCCSCIVVAVAAALLIVLDCVGAVVAVVVYF